MLWEEVKEIIHALRQKDSVRIAFCYAPHGDAVFIHLGDVPSRGDIIGSGSGENAFEDALRDAHQSLVSEIRPLKGEIDGDSR